MSRNDLRRANVQRVIDTRFKGVVAEFARAAGKSAAQVWQFMNERNIGEKLARDLEEKLGLERGELDREPGTSPTLTEDEREMLQNYRGASARWKLALRHMAALRDDNEQEEVASGMNVLLAEILGRRPYPVEKMGPGWQRPDTSAVHEPRHVYKDGRPATPRKPVEKLKRHGK